eukprot:2590127-Amphidinium_carterae.1
MQRDCEIKNYRKVQAYTTGNKKVQTREMQIEHNIEHKETLRTPMKYHHQFLHYQMTTIRSHQNNGILLQPTQKPSTTTAELYSTL